MTHKNPKVTLFPFSKPWEKNTNSIWLATTLCLHRNIDKFHFPSHLDAQKRHLVANLLIGAIKASPSLPSITLYSGDDLTPLDRDFLSEHFLIFDAIKESQRGHFYITEEEGSLLIQINNKDHLEIHIVEISADLEKALAKLIAIECDIEKKLPFSFSNQFGYLSSDPSWCGTALLVNAYLHIPALILRGVASQSFEKQYQENLSYTSLQGNPEDLIGDLLVIRNRCSLGMTEEMTLSSIKSIVTHIISEEKALRTKIIEERDDHAVDKVSRAIGVLQHSFTIDTGESLRALSLVKFGIEIGWIKGMTVEEVNELFFDCRRAHLAKANSPDLYGSPLINKTRAQMFRKRFASLSELFL